MVSLHLPLGPDTRSLLDARNASRTEGARTVATWTSIASALFSLPAAATVWRWPSCEQTAALAAIGLLSAVGTLSWNKA